MNKSITDSTHAKAITRDDLINALNIIGSQDRLGLPNMDRIVLAKYYYPDIDSGLELESCFDDVDVVDQLWNALK